MGEFSSFALVPEQGVVPRMEQLDGGMQGRIRALAQRLNVRDGAAVMGFGAKAQKNMDAFSSIALTQMLSNDIAPLDGVMKTLAQQIRACSFTAQAKGFLRRMLGGAAGLGEVRQAYEKAEPRINQCADEMTDRRVALMRDSALLDRLYERNEALYRELCSLLVVGGEVVQLAKERGEAAQDVERMERRMEDLRVTQVASTQLAAQIRMVQQSNALTCERLQAALEVTIPLWKSQMAAALGLARATDSLAYERRVSSEASRGVRSASRDLRAQAKAYGKESAQVSREQAQQTADALLRELEEIEQSLAAQQTLRKKGG